MAARIVQLQLLARLPEAISQLPEFDMYSAASPTPMLSVWQKLQVWGKVHSGSGMRGRGVSGPRRVLSLRGLGRTPVALLRSVNPGLSEVAAMPIPGYTAEAGLPRPGRFYYRQGMLPGVTGCYHKPL